jgi:transmembrane sensor
MNPMVNEDYRLAEEAAEWVMRLGEDDSATCRNAFFAWFKQSPRHVQEFLEASAVSKALNGMDAELSIDLDQWIAEARRNVIPLAAGGATPEFPHRRLVSARSKVSVAAAIALLAVSAAVFWINRPSHFSQELTTSIGEQRTIKLADGSMMILNTRSKVDVDMTRDAREIHLLTGQALFAVAPDPARPFRVITNDAIVQAIGTQFDVHQTPSGTKVAVIEGSVRMSPRKAAAQSDRIAQLKAGEEALVDARGRMQTAQLADPEKALAWRERRLEFHDVTLGVVAAEFNRYNRSQIHVEEPVAESKRITGLFDADHPEALVNFLRKDGGLRVEEGEAGFWVRGAEQ